MNVPADHLPTRRFALAALAAAAVAGARPADAQAGPIRLGASVDDATMQPFFAQDLGLFKKALGSPFEAVAKTFYIYAWAARRD